MRSLRVPCLILVGILATGCGVLAAAPPQDAASAKQSDAAKSSAQPSATPATQAGSAATAPKNGAQDKEKEAQDKKKAKKVWTNDEIGGVGGTISVVGDSSQSAAHAATPGNAAQSEQGPHSQQIANYRKRLRQLQAQLETTDKKINDLRNFKAEDTSASGGINPDRGYSMTPVADQIKQLEEKRKTIQAQIDDLQDEARKNGIEPGDLR